MLAPSLAAGEMLDATVVNMRFIKPLDVDLVLELARTHDALVTVEEGSIMGGAGAAVAEALAAAGCVKPLLNLGLPDRFIDHGDVSQLLAQCGLNAEGIAASIRQPELSRAGRLPSPSNSSQDAAAGRAAAFKPDLYPTIPDLLPSLQAKRDQAASGSLSFKG
jgi:hypothetical protein